MQTEHDVCKLHAQVLHSRASTNESGQQQGLVRGRLVYGEEISVTGQRVSRLAGGIVQQTYLSADRIIQVATCSFAGSIPCHICVLQPKCLAIFNEDGGSHSVPLPGQFTDVFPLDQGLLITGCDATGPKLLLQPSDDLQPVPTEFKAVLGHSQTEPSNGWRGEIVLWTGADESPYALTVNKSLQKVRLWHFKQGSSTAPQAAYDVNNFWTPQQAKLKRGVLKSPASGSGMKR